MTTDSSSVDSGDAGGAGCKAPPEIGVSEKGQNLTFAYWSLAITASTPGFEKLFTPLLIHKQSYLYARNTKKIFTTFLGMVHPSVWSLVKATLTSQIIGIRQKVRRRKQKKKQKVKVINLQVARLLK